MLLRRITEHVKAQNWTAVALDFVIVVVGVLIAIQLSNWNGAQAERHAERRYLTDLLQDLNADVVELDAVKRNAARNVAFFDVLLINGFDVSEASLGQTLPFDSATLPSFPSRKWNEAFATLFSINTFDPSRQTFDALISTGDIGLLRDHDTVRAIMAYQKAVNEHDDFEENTARTVVALAPFVVQRGLPVGHVMEVEEFIEFNKNDPGVVSTLISMRNLTRARYARASEIQQLAVETLSTIAAARE